PSDALHHQFMSLPGWLIREANAGERQDWAKKFIIMSLFPPPEYVGQVRCLGKISVDGRDYDAYEYDFYRDSESARTFYSYRSMIVEKGSGLPFRSTSVSKTQAHQWVEIRRYDPTLTIPVAPPAAVQTRLESSTGAKWPPPGPYAPPGVSE